MRRSNLWLAVALSISLAACANKDGDQVHTANEGAAAAGPAAAADTAAAPTP